MHLVYNTLFIFQCTYADDVGRLLLLIINCVFNCGLFRNSVVEARSQCCFLVHFVLLGMVIYKIYLLYIHFNYFVTRTIYR